MAEWGKKKIKYVEVSEHFGIALKLKKISSTEKKLMLFLPADKDSRLPSLITHSPRGRAGGCCGPPQASSLDHTSSLPPAQRAHRQC